MSKERRVRPECPLTNRQIEVLEAAGTGMSNLQIGEALGIVENTVKTHMTDILKTLRVPDRTSAVVLVLKSGWVDLEALHERMRAKDGTFRNRSTEPRP